MTPSESQALQDFLTQLIAIRGFAKDPQASAQIANAVAQQPDAAYLLVQRAMLLEKELEQATAQVQQLQNALDVERASPATSFLDAANAWGNSAKPAAPLHFATPPASMPQSPLPASMPNPGPVLTASNTGFFGSNAGSMLGTVAATAAGVAGGALLYQGIGSLMSHQNHGAGLAGQNSLTGLPQEHAAPAQSQSSDSLAADAGFNDIADMGGSDDGGLG